MEFHLSSVCQNMHTYREHVIPYWFVNIMGFTLYLNCAIPVILIKLNYTYMHLTYVYKLTPIQFRKQYFSRT